MSGMTKSALKSAMPAILTCGFAGIVLTILAPYGTHTFSFPGRLAFWVGLCFAGGLGAGLTDVAIRKLKLDPKPWAHVFAQSITATIAVTISMILMNMYIGSQVNIGQILLIFFYVWVVSITISTVGYLISRSATAQSHIPERPTLYDRLPMHLRSSEIFALSAEDHYVRIITSKGEDMVLMRLSDAIKEVAPLDGLSPHRSWWVAANGVEKLAKTKSKSEIILKSGQHVPVSRNATKAVREAGWR